MDVFSRMKWDRICFVSHISGFSVQALTFDRVKGLIRLEDGYPDEKKVEIPLAEELVVELERCFEDINIDAWAEWNYNPRADGERWSIEVYENDELVLLRIGCNAYPEGYGKWMDFYVGLLLENGIEEIHTCYRKEKEGCIFRKKEFVNLTDEA